MSFATIVVLCALLTMEQPAQTAGSSGGRIKAFLDCTNDGCHDDYLREEVEIVEYVRDRTDADVHVLVTSVQTAARGREYTLTFIGQGRFTAFGR